MLPLLSSEASVECCPCYPVKPASMLPLLFSEARVDAAPAVQ